MPEDREQNKDGGEGEIEEEVEDMEEGGEEGTEEEGEEEDMEKREEDLDVVYRRRGGWRRGGGLGEVKAWSERATAREEAAVIGRGPRPPE